MKSAEHVTKRELYEWVDRQKRESHWYKVCGRITPLRYVFDMQPRIKVMFHEFATHAVGGILFHSPKRSTMVLNSRRSDAEVNFDCMHELIHFHRHPYGEHACASLSVANPIRIPAYEWQANEGAAEALVPYREFIPMSVDAFQKVSRYSARMDSAQVVERLAKHFHVTVAVIRHRMESLEFETIQYRRGIPIESIEILSKADIERRMMRARYEGEYEWYIS